MLKGISGFGDVLSGRVLSQYIQSSVQSIVHLHRYVHAFVHVIYMYMYIYYIYICMGIYQVLQETSLHDIYL